MCIRDRVTTTVSLAPLTNARIEYDPAVSATNATEELPLEVMTEASVVPLLKAPPLAWKVTVVPSGAGDPFLATSASTRITVLTKGPVLLAWSEVMAHASGATVGTGLGDGLSPEHPTMATNARRAIQGKNLLMVSDPQDYCARQKKLKAIDTFSVATLLPEIVSPKICSCRLWRMLVLPVSGSKPPFSGSR